MITEHDTIAFTSGRCTIYRRGEFMGNMVRIEASSATVAIGKYAQYDHAVKVEFVPKGARRARCFVDTYQPATLILEGWGHPAPADIFEPCPELTSDETVAQKSRYSSHDPRWQNDFDALMDAHVEATGAKVLGDYRRHNPYSPRDSAAVDRGHVAVGLAGALAARRDLPGRPLATAHVILNALESASQREMVEIVTEAGVTDPEGAKAYGRALAEAWPNERISRAMGA